MSDEKEPNDIRQEIGEEQADSQPQEPNQEDPKEVVVNGPWEQPQEKRTGPFRFQKGNTFGKETWIKPGEVKNPAGRRGKYDPLTLSLAKIMREILCETVEEDPKKRTAAELVARQLVRQGMMKGNVKAIQEIFDRVDGKVPIKLKQVAPEDEESLYELRITVVDPAPTGPDGVPLIGAPSDKVSMPVPGDDDTPNDSSNNEGGSS